MPQNKPVLTGHENKRQLPSPGEVFLDHIGHFVPEPSKVKDALERLGFTVTPYSIQTIPDPAGGDPSPTGTANQCVMLNRGYLEVLSPTADTPLSQQLNQAILQYVGIHLCAFSVADALKEARRLTGSGFLTTPLISISRPVQTETGVAQLHFTVLRLLQGTMPEGRLQFVTHHSEHEVWQKGWLEHPNGARALTSLLIVVDDVKEAANRYQRFFGRVASQGKFGPVFLLDRGSLGLTDISGYSVIFPASRPPSIPSMAAYAIITKSIETVSNILSIPKNIPKTCHAGCITIDVPIELGKGKIVFLQENTIPSWCM
jgi:hypothetical protein